MRAGILICFLFFTSHYSFSQSPIFDSCVYDLALVKEQPQYPGGDSAMLNLVRQNIHYPKLAKENKIQGKVFITFIIDTTGDVIDITLYKGIGASKEVREKYVDYGKYVSYHETLEKEINEEAIRVVKLMPKWKPGIQNGKPVKVRYILPFDFRIPEEIKSSSDSCFVVTELDTTWKIKCVQELPKYPGGEAAFFKFLRKNMEYPKLAKDLGMVGKLYTTFVVSQSGKIEDVSLYLPLTVPDSMNGKKVKPSLYLKYQEAAKLLVDESLRVVRIMPVWEPGKLNGKAVKVRYILPIAFKLT